MLDRQQLLDLVVRPALELLNLNPGSGRDLAEFRRAESQLLMGTQAIESPNFDRRQLGGGPALGIWQMEGQLTPGGAPRTHEDIWINYLGFRPVLARKVAAPVVMHDPFGPPWPSADRLIHDDGYAAKMARIQYLRDRQPIPQADDIKAMDAMYLRVYNAGGASKPGEFTDAYNRLCARLFT